MKGLPGVRWARRLLSRPVGQPRAYSALQRAVGYDRVLRRLVLDALKLSPDDDVLDVGCGPADLLAGLAPSVDYTGLEPHAPYLRAAQARWGHRARFIGGRVEDLPLDRRYQRVLLLGVLHHVSDAEARSMLVACAARLAPGGRLISLEPCPRPGRPLLEQQLYAIDRGRFVRAEAEQLALIGAALPEVQAERWDGMLRLPYSYLLITAGHPARPSAPGSPRVGWPPTERGGP